MRTALGGGTQLKVVNNELKDRKVMNQEPTPARENHTAMPRQHSLLGRHLGKQRTETMPAALATTGSRGLTMRLTSTFLLLALFTFASAWTGPPQ
jgi:hypothetical protein